MITAAEARKKSQAYVATIVFDIECKIVEACNKGLNSVRFVFDKTISNDHYDNVRQSFADNGFKTKFENTFTLTISW